MDNKNSIPNPRSAGEQGAENLRLTFETRGDKTYKAALEARRRELLERHVKIQEELAEIRRRREGNQPPAAPPAESVEVDQPPAAPPAESVEVDQPPAAPPAESDVGAPAVSPESPSNEIPEASGDSHETDNPARREQIERISQKNKRNSGFKKVAQKVALIAMAGLIALGIGTNIFGAHNKQADQVDQPQSTASTIIDQDHGGETMEAEKGIYDGYGEKGMWLSENKAGKYNFAAAKEVAEVCNDDECEMMKYVEHNQVETFADHLANVPDAVKDKYGISADFKGVSILQTESKLESLSKEDFAKLQKQFDELIDGAFTRTVSVTGSCDNAFMRLKGSGSVTHGNMELVKCTTYENGTLATEFYWTDDGTANGNVIGSMTVKFTPEGGCMQVINQVGSAAYAAMPAINPNENTPSTSTHTSSKDEVVTVTPKSDESKDSYTVITESDDSEDSKDSDTVKPEPVKPEPVKPDPAPKNQLEANENSGANDGLVTPESQTRELTEEPKADEEHPYDSGTNTYTYTPDEQAGAIGYEVNNDITQVRQESAPITEPEQQAAAEEAVSNQTAPEMVPGTREGGAGESGQANNFDAGATVSTGEVSGETPSADGSGRTIEQNLSTATGVEGTDYSEGF